MTERTCPDCGLILKLEKKSEYVIKTNNFRNRYYCNRCHENRLEKSLKEFLKKQNKLK